MTGPEGIARHRELEARIESNEIIQRELETLTENIQTHIRLAGSPLWMADAPARAYMWDEFLADWRFIAFALKSMREKVSLEHEFILDAMQSLNGETVME